jgi:hypothetical protein
MSRKDELAHEMFRCAHLSRVTRVFSATWLLCWAGPCSIEEDLSLFHR